MKEYFLSLQIRYGAFKQEFIMDKVKLSFDFLITMIFTLLLAACGGNGGDFSSDASLVSLTLSSGELDQIFQSSQLEYTATVGFLAASTTVTPTVENTNAMVTVNGTAVISGNPSESIFLGQGDTVITVMVTAEDGVTTRIYTITVTRQSASSFAQQAYIKASNTGIDDHFGSVALSGDTLAVGAFLEDSAATGIDGDQADNSAENSGAVYVYQ